jgi:hypothetical protein
MNRRPYVFPITAAEFVVCTAGTVLTIWVVGAIMGVRFFG